MLFVAPRDLEICPSVSFFLLMRHILIHFDNKIDFNIEQKLECSFVLECPVCVEVSTAREP